MQRTHIATVAAAILLVTAGTAGAATLNADTVGLDPDNGLGPLALETGDWTGYDELPDAVATYDGRPGWHVSVNDRDALEDWTASSDKRELLDYHSATGTAIVAAPASHIGTSYLDRLQDDGLHARSYVTGISVVQQTGIPTEPEPSTGPADASEPGLFSTLGLGEPELPTGGIAHSDDAERATMQQSREVINDTSGPDGAGTTVAVLDNSFDYDPDIYQNRVVAARNFITDEDATANNSWENVSSSATHGDWVASAAVGDPANESHDGVAIGANLAFGKVLGANGGTTADIADGLHWACHDVEADVVSMSLGSQRYSPALDAAVQDCVDNGTVVVIAAGNSGQTLPVGISSPADSLGKEPTSDGVIVVAATNASAAVDAGPAYFSQTGPDPGAADTTFGATRGANPTLGAPGMNTTARIKGGTLTLSGTSMATPMVAGAAAVVIGEHPAATPGEVEQRLAHGAAPMPNAGVHEVGAGMLDVSGALSADLTDDSVYADQCEARSTAAETRDASRATLAAQERSLLESLRSRGDTAVC